ncbi:stage II sporulation protein M [Glaciihabitans arcticus]|uniref:Stage II sporulation protein M n=2 Tax=Glaciihabitans arcticus TaxID=2668039 RepID=A0A4Q9GXW5_9MICO|nr:stage II sporulation protein M [Glaciihabitans arcticus]TBN58468.1 stage II sporulation protein M [Glaciihabitans arcticus]
MDLDAYSTAHSDEWQRLAELGKKRTVSGTEADELIERYQSGASNLSAIKTTTAGSIEGERLSLSLSRARLRFTGTTTNVLSRIPEFFVYQLPAALFRIRWLCFAIALGTLFVGFLYGWWAMSDPRVIATMGEASALEQYAKEDFVDYYSNNSGQAFTGFVWTNNAWLAAQCIAYGIVGLYTPYLLFSNAQQLGLTAGIMAEYDRLDVFFLYIAPHGQLELYAIFVAGAGGMRIFWTLIAPGNRTRVRALAEDGRAFFAVVIGLILALLVSGVIEGFVTRQDWPWPIKIGIGTVALVSFLLYQWVVGRRAVRAGQTGDLDEFEAGARELVAG